MSDILNEVLKGLGVILAGAIGHAVRRYLVSEKRQKAREIIRTLVRWAEQHNGKLEEAWDRQRRLQEVLHRIEMRYPWVRGLFKDIEEEILAAVNELPATTP